MPFRVAAASLAALFLLVAAPPGRAGDFTDAAGRRVVLPDAIARVLPADRNAEVLVFVLAPDKLVGLSRLPERSTLLPGAGRLPLIGWRPRSGPESMAATAQQLGADLIIDASPVTPATAAFANAVQQQTGVAYILVDGSFAPRPQTLHC